jgi:hypothetical protein
MQASREQLHLAVSIKLPPDRLCTHGALYADEGGCTLSVGPRSQIGNPGHKCETLLL